MSAHLFSTGTPFFLCLFDTASPLFDTEIPDGLQIRHDHRDHFRNYGHNLRAETPVPAGTPQPELIQETAGSSCDPQKPGKCRKLADTPQRAKALLTTQGQRKVSPASGPNRAPSHWVPQGPRPNTCKSKGEDGHAGSMCQRCASSQGRAPAKETLWRKHWSRSD